MMNVFHIAAAMLLVGAFVTDVRSMRISNKWTAIFFAGGLLGHLVADGWSGLLAGGAGAAAGFIPLLLLYLVKGVGAGDVKLFGALGALIGAEGTWYVFVYSIFYAGAIAAVWLLTRTAYKRIAGQAAMRPDVIESTGAAMRPDVIESTETAAAASSSIPAKPLLGVWAGKTTVFPFMIAVVPAACTYAVQLY